MRLSVNGAFSNGLVHDSPRCELIETGLVDCIVIAPPTRKDFSIVCGRGRMTRLSDATSQLGNRQRLSTLYSLMPIHT